LKAKFERFFDLLAFRDGFYLGIFLGFSTSLEGFDESSTFIKKI
jgi:hypothetical protein